MRFRSLMAAVRDELTAHPTRTLLAAASVVVGITCLVVVVALTGLGERAIRSDIEKSAGRAETYKLDGLDTDGNFLSRKVVEHADRRLAQLGVPSRSRYDGYQAITSTGRSTDLFAVDPSYNHVRSIDLIAGRWYSSKDVRRYPVPVVINKAAGGDLSSDEIGTVSVLKVGDTAIAARVIGKVDDGRTDATVYGLHESLQSTSATLPAPEAGYLYAISPSGAQLVARDLARLARNLEASGVDVRRIDDSDAFQKIFRVIQGVGIGAAAIALIAGSLGFLNLGLASVQQRVRDFGVLRSFGATRASVFLTVLMESVVITLGAGIASVGISWFALQVMPPIGSIDLGNAELPGSAVLVGLVVSVALGLLVGVIPARQATRVDVIDAIRTQ
ncbi:ABC transporter permease [Streptomyces sp. KR80]|uniref:ABC transporter permease n=1 Tax=Streptomyces sp. KR80 TaxID=3457426 RepID=UPI003FD0A260